MSVTIHEHDVQNIYSALEGDETDTDYLANVAMAAMDVIELDFIENGKIKFQSEYFREKGNIAYKVGLFQKALVLYNKALAYAPNKSLFLKLAYSNRSAVLFSTKQYQACEKDCITALAINCPTLSSLTEKLEKRRLQAKGQNFNLFSKSERTVQDFAADYFKLKSHNKETPCASADIGIVFESGLPKVIAKREIPAGTLVAIEKAFVSWPGVEADGYFSCYHCRKLDLNLFPCSGCVVALFCSRKCEEMSMKEYHSIECEIVRYLSHILPPSSKWMITAIMKLRNMCSSWDELISLSHKGCNGDHKPKTNEIYNSSKPASLLCFMKDLHFLHGPVFEKSITCAAILKVLQKLHSFLPQDSEGKLSAIKAMARIMMHWGLYCTTTKLRLVTNVVQSNMITYHAVEHAGLFTFIGKLKHSCMPNLQSLAVNNSMALFALENIESGTELTVSHIFHWMNMFENIDGLKNRRIVQLYKDCSSICSCIVCSNSPQEWSSLMKDEVSYIQKKAAQEIFTFDVCRLRCIPPKKCFDQIYKTLVLLNNVKFSAEYKQVYKMLVHFQRRCSTNVWSPGLHIVHIKYRKNNIN